MYDYKGFRSAGYKLLYAIGIIDIVYNVETKKFYEVDGEKFIGIKRDQLQRKDILDFYNI
jgi:hypothetical protein